MIQILKMSMMKVDYNFDDLLESVGNNGKFQKRFHIIFNFVLVFFASMPYLNIIYAVVVPEHWCKVPGREYTNMSVDEWKNLTIPRMDDGKGTNAFSKCKMYNLNTDYTFDKEMEIIDCQYGWEYDTSYYKKTVPSQENWVCDKELNVANSFGVAKFGEVIGTLLFGQLGDRYGRKRIFFITIIIITIGRCSLTFAAGNIYLWYLMMFFGSSTSTAVFISPLIIAMEICNNDDRSYVAMLQFASCTIALCVMPLLMWSLGEWIPFILITTIPCSLFLFSDRLIIESPRWLATKGKIKRCVIELTKIAKVNKKKLPADIEAKLEKIAIKNENVYGAMSLFSSWRLAKNTILVITAWIVTVLVYLPLTLNVVNLGGNPFINYILQAIAEFPAYILGKYSCDYIGRRCTITLAFIACFVGSIIAVASVAVPNYEIVITLTTVFLKFAISLAAYANQLQLLEIYPTCVRQSGQAVGAVISHASAIFGPYIVYLGTSVNPSYPYMLSAFFCILGAMSGFFLPETLHMNLPETLAEARTFGANQKYFSFNVKKYYKPTKTSET